MTLTTALYDVCVTAGITVRQAHHWIARGYLTAITPPGSGHPVHLTHAQTTHLHRMARLTHAGFTPAAAAWITHTATPNTPLDLGHGLTLTIRERTP